MIANQLKPQGRVLSDSPCTGIGFCGRFNDCFVRKSCPLSFASENFCRSSAYGLIAAVEVVRWRPDEITILIGHSPWMIDRVQ